MKRIVKKNQVVLTLLAVMIAVAGYLNYSGKAEALLGKTETKTEEVNAQSVLTDISDADLLEENQAAGSQLVDVDAFPEENEDSDAATVNGSSTENAENTNLLQDSTGNSTTSSTPGEAILTNGVSVVDYVAAVQLSREQVRARNKETLLSIINNSNLSEELKQSAVETMVKMTETAELESAVETLLSAKGFDNSVVSINEDAVDVVVSRYTLSDAERAQIEDIVERKTGMEIAQIVITLMELAEE